MHVPPTEESNAPHASRIIDCMVKSAGMAPSGLNTQPTLFRISKDSIDLLADQSRRLPVVDPNDRELIISCGAALDHLLVVAEDEGLPTSVETLPDSNEPDLLARIHFRPSTERPMSTTVPIHELRDAIPRRRTVRAAYDDRPIDNSLQRECYRIASEYGVEIVFIEDAEARLEIARLVEEGDLAQFANADFRAELAAWVESNQAAGSDGMSDADSGVSDLFASLGAAAIRRFSPGKQVAKEHRQIIVEHTPILAVLATARDNVENWLAVGRALSRMTLTLTAKGSTASYLNQPIEVETLRPKLREVSQTEGVPQLLLRCGYGPTTKPTDGRPHDEITE